MAKKKNSTKQTQQQNARKAISQEVHQEASRVAKNLFRLPPKKR